MLTAKQDRRSLLRAKLSHLEAMKRLGMTAAIVRIAENLHDAAELMEAERDENTERKPFTPSEAVSIGKRIEEAYKPKAEEAKRQSPGRPSKKGGATCPKVSDSPTRDESKRTTAVASEAAGMSRRTYEKAKAVVEAAEVDPEKHGDIKDERSHSSHRNTSSVATQRTMISSDTATTSKMRGLFSASVRLSRFGLDSRPSITAAISIKNSSHPRGHRSNTIQNETGPQIIRSAVTTSLSRHL